MVARGPHGPHPGCPEPLLAGTRSNDLRLVATYCTALSLAATLLAYALSAEPGTALRRFRSSQLGLKKSRSASQDAGWPGDGLRFGRLLLTADEIFIDDEAE